MKQVVLIAAIAVALAEAWEPGLRVRFDNNEYLGVDYFIDLPKTVAEAEAENWVLTERPEGPLPSLFMYCYPDRVVCVLFDDTNNIAGLQVALPEEQLSDTVYDMEETGFTRWTPSGSAWQTSGSYWALPQYFVNEEILRQPKEVRMAARNSRNTRTIVPYGAVWVTGVGKELVRIADNTAEIDDSIFTRQACFPMMGMHYYYNMSATTDSSIPVFPWFPLVDSGELIATGFLLLGRLVPPPVARQWFERPSTAVVRAIMPYGPDWLYQLADFPGGLTMHIYYVEEPWTITC